MATQLEAERMIRAKNNAMKRENQTGYPHIDKSHLQFYKYEDLIMSDVMDASIYTSLESYANKHLNITAIEYFGRKITYREFLDKIAEYAQAFSNMGIKKGEVVSMTCPNLPETFYSIYALNAIGAVSNLIDPRNNIDRIKQYINQAESTKLITIDLAYPKIERLIDDTNIEVVYTISAADSLPLGLNFIQRAKTIVENKRKGLPNCPKNEMYRPLVEEIEKYKYAFAPVNMYRYGVKDELAIIVNTSGTTGTPKGVMLTNENLLAVADDYRRNGMSYEVGDGFLGIMPSFLAYGAGVGMVMVFELGLTMQCIPTFKPEEFPKLIRKHRPAHFAGVPNHFQYIIEDKKMQNYDLSFIKTAAAGGGAFNPELKKKVNNFFMEHGSVDPIKVGYGCSENTGLATTQIYIGESTPENEIYTAGIPPVHTGIRIQDPVTKEDLKYNQDGEILLTGKGVMKGYINNEEETNKVIEVIDGVRHLHTGDIGHIDENGCLYVVDRMKRMIIRTDGHNVWPNYIEAVCLKHPAVRKCACAGLRYPNENTNGEAPVAFIVIKDGHEAEVEQIINELETISLQELPERDVALDYIVVDDIKMTDAGKVDYKYYQENYIFDPVSRTRK